MRSVLFCFVVFLVRCTARAKEKRDKNPRSTDNQSTSINRADHLETNKKLDARNLFRKGNALTLANNPATPAKLRLTQ